jgi:propionyl-CoA carboxylase beta chain
VEIIFRADIRRQDCRACWGIRRPLPDMSAHVYLRFARSPFLAAERGYIDDAIMPHTTRKRIARALAMLRNNYVEELRRKHDNLPV